MVVSVIAQQNTIQSLVNDVVDLQLIEEGKFAPKLRLFKPRSTFDFVIAMLKPHQELMVNKISLKMASEHQSQLIQQ